MSKDVSPPSEVRVVIMEDHGRLCDVLKRTVSVASGMTCCGHFKTAKDTLEAIPELRPDVISIDLSMPDVNGLTVLKQIRQEWPDIRCIVFSGHADEAYVRHSIDAGAMGYVFKEDVGDFIQSIRTVAAGDYFLSPRFADCVRLPSEPERGDAAVEEIT